MTENVSMTSQYLSGSRLDYLPDIVIGHILTFLHWKEKEFLAQTSCRVSEVLKSSFGWKHFENTRKCPLLFRFGPFNRIAELEKNVVIKFGKYFQHCKLWLDLSNVLDNNDQEVSILQLVSQHCERLKSLCIVHPSHLSCHQIKTCYRSYVDPIRTLIPKRKGDISLSMTRVFYAPVNNESSGLESYLCLLLQYNFHRYLSCLDISHGIAASSTSGVMLPAWDLTHCLRLHTLKCPIQCINTRIVLRLIQANLVRLYLLNDHQTSRINYWERRNVDWNKIYLGAPEQKRRYFQVHYIFQNRFLQLSIFCHNPFARSLVFNNLSSSVSDTFIHAIIGVYGPYINTLAFYCNFWEISMHFTDLSTLDSSFAEIGRRCTQLKMFLCHLQLPSSALLNLAVNSQSLLDIRAYTGHILLSPNDSVDRFQSRMSELLGTEDWRMISPWSDKHSSFDDPLLFSTCSGDV